MNILVLPPLKKIIDFYVPLFYYYLMTPASDNFTYLSQAENKLNYHPARPKNFANF